MDGKTSDWRPGPSVCRCCLAEGCYKDISTEYFWMGKREVYAEMLSDTFSVSIAYASGGGPNSHSRLICEPCISRLRDAADFKRQVLECERTFMQHLDPGGSTSTANDIDLELQQPITKEVKVEQVKLEKRFSDDDFDNTGFGDDDDDDMDDQPLTKFATKVPKKETVDFMDLIDNSQITVKKITTSKSKTQPTKKVKVSKKAPTKLTVSKPSIKVVKEKKKKAENVDGARSNAHTLLRCTTAYPFRVNDKSILCVYCQELYDDPDAFRAHVDTEHQTFSVRVVFHNLPKPEFIKADLTNLRCRLCSLRRDSLETIAEHLITVHNEKIDLNQKLGVMPYHLQKDVFNCAVCGKSVPSLFHLNRHTITHFLSYVCHVCGNSYVASTGLLRHVRSKHQQYEVSCKNCKKVFPTMEAKEKHRKTEKSCLPYCCPKCLERFLHWHLRKRHMETAHGQSKKTYRCVDCNVVYTSENAYYDHYKLHHSANCANCKHCGMKFTSTYRLKRHMTKHNV